MSKVADTESVNKRSIWRPLLHSHVRILTFHLPVFLSGQRRVRYRLHAEHFKQMYFMFPQLGNTIWLKKCHKVF